MTNIHFLGILKNSSNWFYKVLEGDHGLGVQGFGLGPLNWTRLGPERNKPYSVSFIDSALNVVETNNMCSLIHETGAQSQIRCSGNVSSGERKVVQFWVCEGNSFSHLPQAFHCSRTILNWLSNSFRRIVLMKRCDRTGYAKGQNATSKRLVIFPHTYPNILGWNYSYPPVWVAISKV